MPASNLNHRSLGHLNQAGIRGQASPFESVIGFVIDCAQVNFCTFATREAINSPNDTAGAVGLADFDPLILDQLHTAKATFNQWRRFTQYQIPIAGTFIIDRRQID